MHHRGKNSCDKYCLVCPFKKMSGKLVSIILLSWFAPHIRHQDTVSTYHWQPYRESPYHANTAFNMFGTSGAVSLLLHMFPIILTSFFQKKICLCKESNSELQNLNIDNDTPTFSRVFLTCVSFHY